MWEHEFICWSSTTAMTPPSPMDKALLIRAGLGPWKFNLFEYGEYQDSTMRLSEGRGYKLLRTKQNTNCELCVIHHHLEVHCWLSEEMVSQVKIYNSLIQDLPLTALTEENNEANVFRWVGAQCYLKVIFFYIYEFTFTLSVSFYYFIGGNGTNVHAILLVLACRLI